MSKRIIAIDARLVSGTNTGDSTYWTGLLAGLRLLSTDLRFLLFSNNKRPDSIPEHPSFEWHTVHSRSSRWWSYVSFPIAARRSQASVIHTQYSLSPLTGRRGITTIHDVSFLVGPEWFRPRDRAILRLSVPAACRRAARVITVSETSKREIESFIPSAVGKTEVVYNACPEWIQRVPREEAESMVRKATGIEGPFMLTVGTRWPRKNMALALSAAELLSAAVAEKLVITGKPGWGEEVLGNRGLAVGYVDATTLSALYSAASLYLAPSRHEGFGIPLLEAFRCGCPVICSSGGALPEVAGDAAVVVESWRPEDWASQIEALLSNGSKLTELQGRGFLREKRFSWLGSAQKMQDIYESVSQQVDRR